MGLQKGREQQALVKGSRCSNGVSLSKKRSRGDVITVTKCLHWERKLDNRVLFNLADKALTRADGWKLKLDKFRLDKEVQFLRARLINHWKRAGTVMGVSHPGVSLIQEGLFL